MAALTFTALSGCGGQEVAQSETIVLVVEGNDKFQFNPAYLTVPAGTQLSLTFENVGDQIHNLGLINEGVDLFSVDENAVFQEIKTGDVAAGESFRVAFTAPAPGQYTYACLIAGHAAAGMVGTFEVTPTE